jgi:sugar phosphate isomerase/epimerase
LHHLTALDVGPAAFVEIASAVGCPNVALFTHGQADAFPLVTRENAPEVAARLRDLGVALHNVEYVIIAPEMDWQALAEAFGRSAELGARRMTVHCHDPVENRALTSFARTCDLAAEFGLSIGLEWTAVNPVIDCLERADRFIALAGRANADLAVDLLHLARGGGAPGDLARIPPARIGYAQISDGPLVRDLSSYAASELLLERLPPGDGALPVAAFIEALPQDIVIDVEAPQQAARQRGESALERVRRAVTAARRFLPR